MMPMCMPMSGSQVPMQFVPVPMGMPSGYFPVSQGREDKHGMLISVLVDATNASNAIRP